MNALESQEGFGDTGLSSDGLCRKASSRKREHHKPLKTGFLGRTLRNKRPAHYIALCAALCLAACAHHAPDTGLREVAISCVNPGTPKAPDVHTREQLALIPDGPTLFQMMSADYGKMYAWMIQASPALEGCRNAASK